jgi:hypothetical protein
MVIERSTNGLGDEQWERYSDWKEEDEKMKSRTVGLRENNQDLSAS